MSMFTCMVPDMYIIMVAIKTNCWYYVTCCIYTIPITDGDTPPSSSQVSSTTPLGAVKTSSPFVGKCLLAQQVFIIK